MKSQISIFMIALWVVCGTVHAITWTEGYHQINDGNNFSLLYVYGNDTVVDMYGGWIGAAIIGDDSSFNFYDGTIDDQLSCGGTSLTKIYGGMIDYMSVGPSAVLDLYGTDYDNSLHTLWSYGGPINLYATDVTFTFGAGTLGADLLEGKYILTQDYFVWNVYDDTYKYINVLPEPATLLVFSLGMLFLRGSNS